MLCIELYVLLPPLKFSEEIRDGNVVNVHLDSLKTGSYCQDEIEETAEF